jgi:hypothetical protein
MSYNLAVFDPTVAPPSRAEFRKWFVDQTQWKESHGYNNPDVPIATLRNWFMEMIKTFPPMNGPLRSSDPDDPSVTDYSLGRNLIFGAFAGSVAAGAFEKALELAQKHRVGFYNLSDEPGDIWLPGPAGELIKIL